MNPLKKTLTAAREGFGEFHKLAFDKDFEGDVGQSIIPWDGLPPPNVAVLCSAMLSQNNVQFRSLEITWYFDRVFSAGLNENFCGKSKMVRNSDCLVNM